MFLTALPSGAEYHFLGIDLSGEERKLLSNRADIHCHTDMLTDFTDTAALVSLLDHVVTVDTRSDIWLARSVLKQALFLPTCPTGAGALRQSKPTGTDRCGIGRRPARPDGTAAQLTRCYMKSWGGRPSHRHHLYRHGPVPDVCLPGNRSLRRTCFVAMTESHVLQRHGGRHIGGVADCPAAQHERLVGEFEGEAATPAGFLDQRDSRDPVANDVPRDEIR